MDAVDKSTDTIRVNTDDYLKLVSSKIVLNVINNSLKIVNESKSDSNNVNEHLTIDDTLASRKFFNTKRWHCISRPQYKYSCGISSLVSCWNYLYSTIGHGKLEPLSQEYALNLLGFSEPFDEIRFGPFTGNKTLLEWFNRLNSYFGVIGKGSYFYKPIGRNKTVGITGESAKGNLMNQLKLKNTAFIYHCYNHYCCPIGFEREPINKNRIYSIESVQNDQLKDWILIADTSRFYPSIHCIKWTDIELDLNTKRSPYINIRKLDKSIDYTSISNNNSQSGEKNLHCILKFESQNQTSLFKDF